MNKNESLLTYTRVSQKFCNILGHQIYYQPGLPTEQ